MLVIPNVGWDEYEELLEALGERPDLRVTYDDGRLEIVTISDEHDDYKDMILRLAQAYSDERGMVLETRGSATRKRRSVRKGTEPDGSYWVANAHRVIGRRTIDLDVDPPPDVVVEIDITKDSRNKFGIYAAFGVPEIWRYDGARVEMFELTGTTYAEAESSRFFPGLTCSMLQECLEYSKTHGQTETLKIFRQRIQTDRH
jgi:Uma2 family endonuclease